jgi:hypothetical protein
LNFPPSTLRWLWTGLLTLLCAAAQAAPPTAPPAAASAPSTLSIPAPLHVQYSIRGRVGFLPYRAQGDLRWTHDGQSYQARMEVHLFLLGSRVQHSQGRLTPAGLQPRRFVDRVNDDRSVDFDYAAARVRFSEGTEPVPLPEGAQDHLSVFMQLGGLIGAAPQRYPAGTAITFAAMGIYGPETWRFEVAGEEKLDLPGGELAAVRLTRAATRADEPNAELWLAPALGWLPARIRLWQDNGAAARPPSRLDPWDRWKAADQRCGRPGLLKSATAPPSALQVPAIS